MAGLSWNDGYLKVHTKVITDDADLKITSANFGRSPNNDAFQALNTQDENHVELGGGTNTFDFNLRVVGNPAAKIEELLSLESRSDASGDCPPRNFLFNPLSNSGVPTTTAPIMEFTCPLVFDGLTGGEAKTAIMTENSLPANTYHRVTALPVTPATFANDAGAITATTIDLTWDLDVELYTRQAGLERVAYFVVEQSETTGGPAADPFLAVSPAEGVPNAEDVPGSGKVRFQVTGLTTATTYFFQVKAVDQYGMESLYAAEVEVLTA